MFSSLVVMNSLSLFLTQQVFPSSVLTDSFSEYSSLRLVVSGSNCCFSEFELRVNVSAVLLIGLPLYRTCCFSLAALDIFSFLCRVHALTMIRHSEFLVLSVYSVF